MPARSYRERALLTVLCLLGCLGLGADGARASELTPVFWLGVRRGCKVDESATVAVHEMLAQLGEEVRVPPREAQEFFARCAPNECLEQLSRGCLQARGQLLAASQEQSGELLRTTLWLLDIETHRLRTQEHRCRRCATGPTAAMQAVRLLLSLDLQWGAAEVALAEASSGTSPPGGALRSDLMPADDVARPRVLLALAAPRSAGPLRTEVSAALRQRLLELDYEVSEVAASGPRDLRRLLSASRAGSPQLGLLVQLQTAERFELQLLTERAGEVISHRQSCLGCAPSALAARVALVAAADLERASAPSWRSGLSVLPLLGLPLRVDPDSGAGRCSQRDGEHKRLTALLRRGDDGQQTCGLPLKPEPPRPTTLIPRWRIALGGALGISGALTLFGMSIYSFPGTAPLPACGFSATTDVSCLNTKQDILLSGYLLGAAALVSASLLLAIPPPPRRPQP